MSKITVIFLALVIIALLATWFQHGKDKKKEQH
jgi:hypothetical protein